MKCPIHLCIGQEMPSVLIHTIFQVKFQICCHHRSHAYFLSQTNFDIKDYFLKLWEEAVDRLGFAGSRYSDMKSNFHAGAIITGSVGIAIGDAINNKLQK